jgi:hypothetical protein
MRLFYSSFSNSKAVQTLKIVTSFGYNRLVIFFSVLPQHSTMRKGVTTFHVTFFNPAFVYEIYKVQTFMAFDQGDL